jgi:hypothetical protein
MNTQRFWRKVAMGEGDACWMWRGARNRDGYGNVKVAGATVGAHRVAYLLAYGHLEPGRELHHICGNRACVRPDHLQEVTDREHIYLSPNNPAYANAMSTHCHNGHPFTPANTYRLPGDGPRARIRGCRACNVQANARYRARKKAGHEPRTEAPQ